MDHPISSEKSFDVNTNQNSTTAKRKANNEHFDSDPTRLRLRTFDEIRQYASRPPPTAFSASTGSGMSLDLNTVLQLVTDLPPTSTTSRNLICQLANKVLLSIPKSSQVPADSKAMLATLSTQLESSGAKPDTIRLFTQHFGHSADVYLATALTKELSLELGPGRASTILNLANMELRRQQHEHAQVDANAVANQGLLATRTLPNTAQAPRIAACGPKPNNFPDRRAEHPLPPRPTQRMLP